jgi:hypothetical protein
MQTELTQSYVTYQAQTRLLELAVEIGDKPRFEKSAIKTKLRLNTKIRLWLKALQYSDYLDKDTIDKLVYCLADLCDANAIPYAPVVTTVSPPSILVGIRGADGEQGAEGPEGGGIPFSAELSATGVADSFDISIAEATEWRIVIKGVSGTEGLRIMRLMGGWSEDGSDYGDDGGTGQTIYGDTSPVTMSVVVSGTTAQLTATITSGDWEIFGSRVYIPTTGTSIVSPTSLSSAKMWVGNASNVPTAVDLSGDVTIANDGEVTITKKVAYSDDSTNQIAIKVIEIGDWDMDTTQTVSVTHGLDVEDIISVSVTIRSDNVANIYPIWYPDQTLVTDPFVSGYFSLSTTEVVLNRVINGTFDSTAFNLTPFNRGFIKIEYYP